MPTLDSIVKNSALLSDVSMKYLTPPNFTPPEPNSHFSKSILAGEPFNTMNTFVKDDLFGAQPTLSKLLDNYTESKDNFGLALKENLDSLKDSSDRLKDLTDAKEAERKENATGVLEELAIDDDNDDNTGSALSTLESFAEGEMPPEQTNLANVPISGENSDSEETAEAKADESDSPQKQDALHDFAREYLTAEKTESVLDSISQNPSNSRIDEVKNLVRNFNSALSYLNENRGVSNLMSALADKFGNNTKLSESLNEIGITVDAQGFLALNESIFNQALDKNEDDVESLLGEEGLAGQLDKDINLANYQGDRLFTSVLDYLSQQNQDDAESLYANNAGYAKENVPRFLAMWT